MYAACLFCQHSLGANETVEAFPVGRRLAFDAAKGRLWVVCPKCERWNLTPLEERWEAIEQCERLFADTRLRVATDHVGLARLPEGLELVRIGRPQRPELAAWRYGDQFGRRRRRVLAGSAAIAGTAALGVATLPASALLGGIALGAAGTAALTTVALSVVGTPHALFVSRWVPDGEGRYLRLTPNELPHVKLGGAPGEDGWALRVPYQDRRDSDVPSWRDWVNTFTRGEVALTGPAAREAARRVLPLVNGSGASGASVQDAVRTLEGWGGAEQAFGRAASNVRAWAARQTFGDTGALMHLPRPVRLALEMAAHEEQERRALEGELAELERAWQDAEQIARIADDLLLPGRVRSALDRLRGRAGA